MRWEVPFSRESSTHHAQERVLAAGSAARFVGHDAGFSAFRNHVPMARCPRFAGPVWTIRTTCRRVVSLRMSSPAPATLPCQDSRGGERRSLVASKAPADSPRSAGKGMIGDGRKADLVLSERQQQMGDPIRPR
jgi:hypothetical protein